MPEQADAAETEAGKKSLLFLGAANLLCQFHELINDWRRLNCIKKKLRSACVGPCSIKLCAPKGGQAGVQGAADALITWAGASCGKSFLSAVGPGGEGNGPPPVGAEVTEGRGPSEGMEGP